MSDNPVSNKWNELKELINVIDLDLVKNAEKGNATAGVRARKGLRHLQAVAKELVKLTIETEKNNKSDKE